MATKARRHVHKYHQVDIAGVKVWACALPNCSHYMPDHMKNLIPGKASICWNCDDTFTLDPSNMKDDRPVCSECKFINSAVS